MLSGTALKMELHKDTLPLFTFAHGNSGFIQSSWRLEDDGNMLIKKLIDGIHNNGGKVVCNAEVTELVEKEGKIAYALCSNGERYEADTFISNVHPDLTCSLVKESSVMKGIYRKRLAQLENTFGMFTVSLRLKDNALPKNLCTLLQEKDPRNQHTITLYHSATFNIKYKGVYKAVILPTIR